MARSLPSDPAAIGTAAMVLWAAGFGLAIHRTSPRATTLPLAVLVGGTLAWGLAPHATSDERFWQFRRGATVGFALGLAASAVATTPDPVSQMRLLPLVALCGAAAGLATAALDLDRRIAAPW